MIDGSPTDADLIHRIRDGETARLAELYRRFGRAVYGVAFRMTADKGSAEEITQDVFERVWKKPGSYEPGLASVQTWIMRIARNRCIDELRRRKPRPEHAAAEWQRYWEQNTPSSREVPEEQMARQSERLRVKDAVSTLPAEQREALSMAFFGGYTHVQIARALGQPVGSIKTRILLAMHGLRALLDDSSVRRAQMPWRGKSARARDGGS
jgi:RNA polymerase sigma-70 factor (ECF subfamily)